MSKSIVIKFIMTLLIVILINGMFYSSSYAIGDIISSGKDFLSKGNSVSSVIDEGQLKSTSNYIYNTLLAVAIVVAVIVAMVLGIQFMAASADEKAKVKEALIPFVVGCIVVFGSFTIWKVAVNIGNKTEGPILEGTDAELQDIRMKNSEILQTILDGNIDSLDNEDLITAYNNNSVRDWLVAWTNPEADRRSRRACCERRRLWNDVRGSID